MTPIGRARRPWLEDVVPALLLFAICLVVRVVMQSGFVMGDDMAVVAVADTQSEKLHWVHEQVNLRFGVWLPYILSFKIFGTGELGFFAPTWIMSSSFGSVAFILLRRWGYSVTAAFFAGLFVGLSPFEMLIGTSMANDIILAAVFIYGFVAWQYRDAIPRLSGALIGALLWFGFFNKAWVIYAFPFLGIEFLRDFYNRGRRMPFWAFLAVTMVLLHAAVAWSCMRALHDPFPFLRLLPAHYPVPRAKLREILLIYPREIFIGDDEMRTTLFGAVPYVWIVAFCAALVLRGPRRVLVRDRANVELLAMSLGMFLLINFVPNYYSLTEYHSAPRIFRYLTPISFFLSFFTAKLLVDCAASLPRAAAMVVPVCAAGLLAVNVIGAVRATGPGRENRRIVEAATETITAECPPELLMDNWQGYFFNRLYLKRKCPKTIVRGLAFRSRADDDAEKEFHNYEAQIPDGSMMVTGFGSYVYYPCYDCRIEPAFMKTPIAKQWEVVREIGPITFKPAPIDVKVWRWRAK
jgi:hypothetical protein